MANPYVMAGMAGVQVISGLQQAELIRETAKISKKINDMNAEFAEIDSWNAELDGFEQANRYESQVEAVTSEQKVAYAAQDVDINFGTAKVKQQESEVTGFLNILDIKNQAHAKALGLKREARNIRMNGVMAQGASNAQAQATQLAGVMNAGSTVVSGYTKK